MMCLSREWRVSGVLSLALVLSLGSACGSDDESGAGSGSGGSGVGIGTGGATASPGAGGASDTLGTGGSSDVGGEGVVVSCDTVIADGNIVITDPTNYTFSNDMTVGVPVLKGATDLRFDWSGVTVDLFGHPLNPATDIEMVLLTLWRMTPAELEANLEDDNLPTSKNKGVVNIYPADGVTAEHLMNFGLNGAPLSEADRATLWSKFDTSVADYAYPAAEYTFMVTVSSSQAFGKKSRMLSFFTLDPNGMQTELMLTSESTAVDIDVNLRSAVPIAVPMNNPNLTIDWSQMTLTAMGNEFSPVQINEAIVGHYPDLTLAQIEEQFLDLETLPGRRWTTEVESGVTMNLGTLLDANGAAFPGVDSAQGVWLVALRCTQNCNNPAPWSITILQPC